jgi:hypothetical protein
VVRVQLARDGKRLAVATIARIAKQDLLFHRDVPKEASAELGVGLELDVVGVRGRLCQEGAEANVVGGEETVDHVTLAFDRRVA